MLVERKTRWGKQDSRANGDAKYRKDSLGSRFAPLMVDGVLGGDVNGADGGILSEGKNDHTAVVKKNNGTRVLSKGGSGHLGELSRGAEMGINTLARHIVSPKDSGPSLVGLIQLKEVRSSKALGKKPMVIRPRPETLLELACNAFEEDEAHASGLMEENVDLHLISSGIMKNNLVLNNSMFEGSNEVVVNLDAPILDPKHYLAVIFSENNAIKMEKEAISSMVNLINSQVGPREEMVGGSAEGQTGGPGSTST
ncbi:hypothetical protein J1N35_041001 [Gossypium stocksii]|uniref:Uncharacterized protein n=1 Tax=Gossypium stocksii TaxID=47602 RepID=A0A9D3UF64_9ROSI|nr:hypothetical protein J1N35_041001 [Gossypium stocksii]